MDSNVSLADIAAVTDRDDGFGFGGGGFFWIFALLILPMLWGGGPFGGRCNGEPVTEAGLCNAMNFNNLENAVGRLSDSQAAIARQTDNAICNLGYQALSLANQNQRDLCTGFTNVTAAVNAAAAQQAQCCCETQRAIDGVNYNASINTRDIIASQQAGTQRILDFLCHQENQNLRDENLRCFISGQTANVVRYPTQYAYNAGPSPFCGYGYDNGCGRCCNGNI